MEDKFKLEDYVTLTGCNTIAVVKGIIKRGGVTTYLCNYLIVKEGFRAKENEIELASQDKIDYHNQRSKIQIT
jgi:hypothetical protein